MEIPAKPHPTRLILPHQTHHIVPRGNNLQVVFLGQGDRQVFLRWLGESVAIEGRPLHAYVLMTNHFHLFITAGKADPIPRLMQSLRRCYVSHVNRECRRTGTLWEGRHKSTILDSENYVLVCHRYVASNPVRVALVSRPEDYPWSSYRHNALGTKDPLLREHATYTALVATVATRRAAYRELFGPGLTGEQLETIRDATQRGWVPGTDRSRQQVERALGRRVDPPIRGRPPKAPAKEKLAAKAK